MYRSLTKEGPLIFVRPTPNFASISCLGIELTSKSAHLANRKFPLFNKLEDVVRHVYTH